MMKYCSRPFSHVHILPDGRVSFCSWEDEIIGNLHDNSLEEIWNGKLAQKGREAFFDQTFRYCRVQSCHYLENDSLERVTEEEFDRRAIPGDYPERFNLAFDFICNHSCPSCRSEVFIPSSDYRENLQKMIDKIQPYLNKAEYISANGNGDLFANPQVIEMLGRIRPENPKINIGIETNGVLFDEENWGKIKNLGNYNLLVTVTPNSFDRNTYRYLSGGHDNLERLKRNLHFISNLRQQEIINRFDISIVVQDTNYRELPEFSRISLEEFKADRVVVKPIYRWFNISADDYWVKDILNPLNPYFNDYQEILKDPILKDPRVYFWGGHNIHAAKKHPAYRYRDMLELASTIIKEDNSGKNLTDRLLAKGYSSVILYGDEPLTDIVIESLRRDKRVEIRYILASVHKRCEISGIPIKEYDDYCPDEKDVLLVVNFPNMEQISKEFSDTNRQVNLFGLDTLYSDER